MRWGKPPMSLRHALQSFATCRHSGTGVKGTGYKIGCGRGFAEQVWLCQVVYDDDSRGHLLAFINAEPNAERALANPHEALHFRALMRPVWMLRFLMRMNLQPPIAK